MKRALPWLLLWSLSACQPASPLFYRVSEPPVQNDEPAPPPAKPPVEFRTKTVTRTVTVVKCPPLQPYPLTRGEAGRVSADLREWILSVNAFVKGCQ